MSGKKEGMKVAVGSDHAGFELKQEVAESLRKEGYDVIDVGTNSTAAATLAPARWTLRAIRTKGGSTWALIG